MSYASLRSHAALAGPSDPEWRKKRLLSIGTTGLGTIRARGPVDIEVASAPDAQRPLLSQEDSTDSGHWASYGTVGPASGAHSTQPSPTTRLSQSFASLRDGVRRRAAATTHEGDTRLSRPRSLWTLGKRPLTAYDMPLGIGKDGSGDIEQLKEEVSGVRNNGVRVWYSSFTSIDWLHDQVSLFELNVDDV